jgi:hypothetical protein
MRIKDWELLSKDKSPEDSTLFSCPHALLAAQGHVFMCQDYVTVLKAVDFDKTKKVTVSVDIPIEVMITLMNYAGYDVKVREPK